MKVKLDDGAILPTRAHDTDAGLDLYAREDPVITPKLEVVQELDETERGNNGFGSTGR